MAQSVSKLKKESAEKDIKIKLLTSEIAQLKITTDELEKQGRTDSVRICGLPESGPGSVDEKVLALQLEDDGGAASRTRRDSCRSSGGHCQACGGKWAASSSTNPACEIR